MALIAIDGRFLGTGTGLANYTSNLLAALVSEASHDYVLLTRPGVGVEVPVATIEADMDHYSLAEQTRLPKVIASTGCDLAFFPHFNAPVLSRTPFVVTVHDLILHRHPGDASFAKRSIYRALLRRNLSSAAQVIAVSEWTRRDLRSHYGQRIDKKISVSGEGAGPAFRPRDDDEVASVRRRLGLEGDYLLYAGNTKPHKNVATLVAAHRASAIDADLVLVSGDPGARAFAGPGVIIARGVDDDSLAALYTGARAFVTASLDEGYCLPVAEALACGCPVIASNRGAIPETSSGHATLVEPKESDLAAALRDPVRSQPPVHVGSWSDAAARTVSVFDRALADAARR